mmetsp:Transcript_34841/g.70383  ORF Transcript_34841/g.70383 Transcript_34841/m.70383 type:complete len:251 (-) Transcript_34841:11-763(-)
MACIRSHLPVRARRASIRKLYRIDGVLHEGAGLVKGDVLLAHAVASVHRELRLRPQFLAEHQVLIEAHAVCYPIAPCRVEMPRPRLTRANSRLPSPTRCKVCTLQVVSAREANEGRPDALEHLEEVLPEEAAHRVRREEGHVVKVDVARPHATNLEDARRVARVRCKDVPVLLPSTLHRHGSLCEHLLALTHETDVKLGWLATQREEGQLVGNGRPRVDPPIARVGHAASAGRSDVERGGVGLARLALGG